MNKFIFLFALCLFMFSCNNDEHISEEITSINTELELRSDDIVIGTICPECDFDWNWSDGGDRRDGKMTCLTSKKGFFSFTVSIFSLNPLEEQAAEILSDFLVNGVPQSFNNPRRQELSTGGYMYYFTVKIPVESICAGKENRSVVETISVSFNDRGKEIEKKSRDIKFCCP